MSGIVELLKANYQVVFTGAPGTGKTHLAIAVAAQMVGCEPADLGRNTDRFGFVQFHPSYDYSDFVEGLKPHTCSDHMTFQLQDGSFKQFCKNAAANADKDYVFVIDEINRADISRVFGELFFAIEPGYRGHRGVRTQYHYMTGEELIVPRNLYIIGTMNDIDRSVESIDFALRRRFAWVEIKADGPCFTRVATNLGVHTDEARKRYSSLNAEIERIPGLGTSYQIGPAYFRNLQQYTEKQDPFTLLWNNHLQMLLKEYLRGMPDRQNYLKQLQQAYGLDSAVSEG